MFQRIYLLRFFILLVRGNTFMKWKYMIPKTSQ